RDQAALCQHLVDRLHISNEADVAVCILDTGVNNGHPLMRPVLSDDDLHALKPQWGTHDSRGHGTLMAGLAAYGDLQAALESNEPVTITHILES
uniref:S8 family serine peptidase n=1 Tax=Klebsiella pneumoniae TaxID=573 RepID=UPI00117A5AB4